MDLDERQEALNLARMAHFYEQFRIRMSGILDLALLGLKTAALLNGGAIVALFTLVGHNELHIRGSAVYAAVLCFVGALACVMIAMVLGFLSQNNFAHFEMHQAERIYWNLIGREIENTKVSGSWKWWGAIVAACLSILLFIVGSVLAMYGVAI